MFDLFVQGDRTLARSQGGFGVGLTLVKRLVDMHEGRVTVHSGGPGQGSVFSIYLPAVSGVTPAAQVERPSRAADSLRRRVLIVDDNVDAADSVALILKAAGYDVRCVYDGPSVLNVAKVYRPDIVVLDIGLPGKDGYEVARELRAHAEFRETPIVAVTGYGQESDRRRSQQVGINLHLTKPVDPVLLQQFVSGRRDRADQSQS